MLLPHPSWLRRLGQVALVVGLLGASRPATAAAFDFNDTTWEGTSELLALARTRLGSSRVEIVAAIDWEKLKPSDGLLILHPTVEVDYDEASAFLRAGGRVAVLDDFGKGAALLERFQIRRTAAPHTPARRLRNDPALAIAVPAVQLVAGQEQGRHPVVAQVREVVTNHPTAFTHPNLTPVLKIPAQGEPDATLAVTGIIVNRGRLFAMADPSATINLMLRYPGNRAFAEGLIDYLVEDDGWGQRGGKIYLVANEFKQRGSYGGGTSLSQELRDQLEGFTDMVAGMHDDGLPDIIAMLLSALAGIAAVAWAVSSSLKIYRRMPPRYALAQPLVAQGGVAGRAAVLGAPSTHRALALLELKSALEEGLASRVGVAPNAGSAALLAAVESQGVLSEARRFELRRVLGELSRAENAVAASQPFRVTQQTVEATRRAVLAILSEANAPRGES
ncbi:MAG: DUF4350 domain-containing protein [Polyangiaceae bacterium]